ncbi:hypothetical protein R1flu_025258 [Riccia fluitans]|uniref:Protein SQS1 n=1 Tax=Riccia fluitans TaxID=41844 RepID=A0ABD1XX91_9MARC
MARGKQRKNGSSFVNNLNEDARGRRRGGKGGGRGSVRNFDDYGTPEGNLARGLVELRGRGKKRAETFQLKYSRRYDDLVYTELDKPEISNSMSLRPSSAKPNSSRRQNDGLQNDASNGSNAPVRGNDSLGRKMRKSGTQAYNTVVYNYGKDGFRGKAVTSDEVVVYSSDMDATAEVVLPGTENLAEVIVDRGGNVGKPVATTYSPTEGLTWGLGYVDEQDEILKETANAKQPDENVVRPTSGANPSMGSRPSRKQKGKRKTPVRETGYSRLQNKPRKADPARGFLSIGGMKIYTDDISDVSDDDDSCTDQMDEGFADEDNSYISLSRKDVRLNSKRAKDRRKIKHSSSPDRYRFSAITLDSSDGENDSYESSDSDISDELVEDYLVNCEGLAADIDDPSWVIKNQKSLQYPHIDGMDIADDTSEEEDFDPESLNLPVSGSELEDCLKDRYRTTADVYGRHVTRRKSRDLETGDSDVETEDLEQKAIFGYDSDTSSTGSETEDALLSDDEVRIRDLELDDEARIRDLENSLLRTGEEDMGNSGGFISVSVENETTAGVLPTTSVGTQTLAAAADEPGYENKKFISLRSNTVPKYRSVGQFVSGVMEEVSFAPLVPAQAWPFSRGKSVKKSKGVPGQKKLERQKTIKEKRRERAAKRGFDIDAVNKELEIMVRQKKDVIAFEPMMQNDRKMVHTLAKFYKLNGASQGTTKRRFVVVSVTQNTCMPSGEEKIRLLKFLGKYKYSLENEATSSRPLTGEERRKLSKMRRAARQAFQGMETPVSRKSSTKSPSTSGRFAETSRGRGLEGEEACITHGAAGLPTPGAFMEQMTRSWSPKENSGSSGATVRKTRSNEFACFEAHTTGFASKMMAKMGYVEGRGLGREKQGIAQPLEAVIRPKSLGLGARV